MTPKTTIAGLGATAIIMGVVDVSTLDEKPIERTETIANEIVEAKQVGNIVETIFPWKGEQGLTIKYDMGEPTLTEKFNDERKKEVVTEVVDNSNGFKIDILLKEKPSTNIFCYQIDGAENYNFHYQPSLTDLYPKTANGLNNDTWTTIEEIDPTKRMEYDLTRGMFQPEDMIGSIAIYHKTLKNHRIGGENYATGKVAHIPRPEVWELNNKASTTEWAELSYTQQDGLCVTVRQGFLDNATYPVRIDPTIGYTTAGTAYILTQAIGNGVAMPEDGTLDSISYFTEYHGGGTDYVFVNNWTGTLDLSGSVGSNINSNSASISFGKEWKTINISQALTGSTNYFLGSTNDVTVYLNYDTTGAVMRYDQVRTKTDFGTTGWTGGNFTASVYGTYTAGGGGGGGDVESEDFWDDI